MAVSDVPIGFDDKEFDHQFDGVLEVLRTFSGVILFLDGLGDVPEIRPGQEPADGKAIRDKGLYLPRKGEERWVLIVEGTIGQVHIEDSFNSALTSMFLDNAVTALNITY
jgi:hypothetical protein